MASVSTQQQQPKTQSSSVVLAKDFKASGIKFTEPKKRDGKFFVSLLNKESTFFVESPWLQAPFSISTFQGDNTEGKEVNKKWTLPLSAVAQSEDEKETVKQFFQELEALDNANCAYLVSHPELAGKAQNGKAKSKAVIEETMWRVMKKNKDPQYADRINPTIYSDRGEKNEDGTYTPNPEKPGITVFMSGNSDEQHPETYEELQNMIPKGSFVKAILSIREAITPQNAGLTCSAVQLLVKKRMNNKLSGYAFSDPASSSGTNNENGNTETTVPDAENVPVSEEKADSDHE